MINTLSDLGVEYIFGYPGASVLSVYDALEGSAIRHILTAHEQGACFAAEGYSRASSKIGVVLTTSGPGATNLVTGIADAYMDSIPLIAITGNVSLDKLGHDSFQEVDIFDMTMPVTKYNMIIKSAGEIQQNVKKAFEIALSGRKGPVLIDIPSNVFDQKAIYKPTSPLQVKLTITANENEIEDALNLIKQSSKPLLYVGGGAKASNASNEIKRLANTLNCPVLTTYMGIGVFNPDDEKYLGVMSNDNQKAKDAIKECDLFITLGARFNSRYNAFDILKKRKIPLLQVDIDAAEIDKNLLTTSSVLGDVKEVVECFNQKLQNVKNNNWNFEDYIQSKSHSRISDMFDCLSHFLDTNTVTVTDVGLHQVWTALNYKIYQPENFLTSGGLGTMGFSMGAAIGAHFATGKKVLVIVGDGSFNMNFNELATAVKHHIPLIVVVFNNNSLGMVRKLQTDRGNKRPYFSSLYLNTDYVKLAEAMGARGVRIDENDDVAFALKTALNGSLPLVVDFKLGINEGI